MRAWTATPHQTPPPREVDGLHLQWLVTSRTGTQELWEGAKRHRLTRPMSEKLGHGRKATMSRSMAAEVIEKGGTTYAEILWADTSVQRTTFFSPAESSFQFGLLAHAAGYREQPHFHRAKRRQIDDLQQMFVVQRGVVDVQLFTDDGQLFREVRLSAGDAIVLIHGVHAIKVIEDFQALSVKQGPFYGDEEDRVPVRTD
jgi:hypothetical protein